MRALEKEIHKLKKKLMYLEIAVLGASFFWERKELRMKRSSERRR